MYTVLTCVEGQHDLRLLLVALVICIISMATGVAVYARAAAARGVGKAAWSALAGFVAGCGVWATHFVSMLAYRVDVPVDYAFNLTAFSLAASIVILSCGFFIAAHSKRPMGRMAGGAVVGAGIISMHLFGVAAVQGATVLSWDRPLMAIAFTTAIVSAAAALMVAGRGGSVRRLWAGAALTILAICGMHFTAMAALVLAPENPIATPAATLARLTLAVEVAGVVTLILAAAIAMLVVSHISARLTLKSLQSALDQAPTAIGFFDRRQRLTFWNQPYAELFAVFGVTPAIGLRFDDILAACTAIGVPYRATSSSVQTEDFSWGNPPDELELPDGRVMHAKAGPTRDGGLVAVLVDVTQVRQAEKAANDARLRAEAANRLKSDFLANMSHEIRTPLNGVLGMAQVMAANHLDTAQRDRLKVVIASGESLLSLLNDLLDLATVEAGKMTLADAPFDLEAALRPAWDILEPVAAQKAIAFNVTIAPAAAGLWRGDAMRLRQLVSNLAANAVKFTPQGSVNVLADVTDANLRITVSDTGIGMKPDQIPRLFETFTQGDSSSTRVFGGLGLGLSICQDLAKLMGGRLVAESLEGHGSTFTFTAPLRRPDPSPITQPAVLWARPHARASQAA